MAAESDSDAPSLEKLWLGGKTGCLAPWSEAKAWALRTVWKETHKDSMHGVVTRTVLNYGLYTKTE